MNKQHWTDYKISLSASQSVRVSLSVTQRVQRSTGHNFLPIVTKRVTKVESQEM